jgi:hypothetical protein
MICAGSAVAFVQAHGDAGNLPHHVARENHPFAKSALNMDYSAFVRA